MMTQPTPEELAGMSLEELEALDKRLDPASRSVGLQRALSYYRAKRTCKSYTQGANQRVVSKAELLKLRFKLNTQMALLKLLTLVILNVMAVCFFLAFVAIVGFYAEGKILLGLKWGAGLLLSAGNLRYFAYWTDQLAKKNQQKLSKLHANIVDNVAAPSPRNILVRASEEPAQEQQTVLLRAAVPSEQKSAEELLRVETSVASNLETG